VLKDKLKEDLDWVPTSENYDGIRLYQLITKYVMKQKELQYKYLAIQEEFGGVLNFMQSTEMMLNLYNEMMANRVDIAKRAGCLFLTQALLQMETDDLHAGKVNADLTDAERAIVRGVAKEKFLAVLILKRSDMKNVQLKDCFENDQAKGVKDAFPVTFQQAMQLMADYRPVRTVAALPPAQGNGFCRSGRY
jgi:hypothetical protein